MSNEQFFALELWMMAMIEARVTMRNAGPEVYENRQRLEQRRAEAQRLLVGAFKADDAGAHSRSPGDFLR
jgi:hypothetical protein